MMEKEAQLSFLKEKMHKLWPHISIAAITSFLVAFMAQNGNLNQLEYVLKTNPEEIREAIPEIEPDFVFSEKSPFQEILTNTLELEGGYSNDPVDRGGETNYGITKNVYQSWLKKHNLTPTSMKNISLEDAQKIYDEYYWQPIQGNKLPPILAQQLFDYAVHSGPRQAIRDLQKILGVKVDGIMGPKTLSAIQSSDPNQLAEQLLSARESFLHNLVKKLPEYKKFQKGFLNRIKKMRNLLNSSSKPFPVKPSTHFRMKHPPQNFAEIFSSPQADFWSTQKWKYRF